ncbi:hypothetical protein V2H37_12325, partial [Avibacterium paragallinarum]|nr:hypothetical protein [Avibacterium paragallinarum]
MTNENIIRLRISSQKALIGKITEEVRGVYVNVYNPCINLYVIIDGAISEYWSEAIYEIGTEIV